jgi:hypothetical protein
MATATLAKRSCSPWLKISFAVASHCAIAAKNRAWSCFETYRLSGEFSRQVRRVGRHLYPALLGVKS